MDRNLAYADDMAAKKPTSRPIAKALPHPNGKGWAGQFALPGTVPEYVKLDGRTAKFQDPGAAEIAALRAMRDTLTARTLDKRLAGGYLRMSGAELSVALVEADLTPTEFAELCGVPQFRVVRWMDGLEDVPHSAHVLVRLLAIEENYQVARSITDRVQSLRVGLDDGRADQE